MADDAGFIEFVRSRQPGLIRFAWLLCGGAHGDAEDLVQEALVRVYRRWGRLDDAEAFARTAMVRLNISRWRKLRREVLTGAGVERGRTDPDADPDAELLRAVLALPARQRAAVVLRFWLDHSDEQIAEALGCAPVTVRTNIHRALARMRTQWTDPVRTGKEQG